MKIEKLISKLTKLAKKYPKAEIVLATDEEGNSFNDLQDVRFSAENQEGSQVKDIILWP